MRAWACRPRTREAKEERAAWESSFPLTTHAALQRRRQLSPRRPARSFLSAPVRPLTAPDHRLAVRGGHHHYQRGRCTKLERAHTTQHTRHQSGARGTNSKMAPQQAVLRTSVDVPTWLRWWLGLSAALVVYDAGYALLRPWTWEDGPLSGLYQPYNTLYANVDLVYSKRRWAEGLRFCEAQSVCNVVEVALQLLALRLLSKGGAGAQAGALLALVSQSLTFWKTTLYWLIDILEGFSATGHNGPLTWIAVYMLPNGLWLVFPLLAVVELGSQVLAVLRTSALLHAKAA